MSVVGDRMVTPWIDKGTLVRISIGLEDPADLWRDLEVFIGALGQGATEQAA
jgi:cystathionine beta-lyase